MFKAKRCLRICITISSLSILVCVVLTSLTLVNNQTAHICETYKAIQQRTVLQTINSGSKPDDENTEYILNTYRSQETNKEAVIKGTTYRHDLKNIAKTGISRCNPDDSQESEACDHEYLSKMKNHKQDNNKENVAKILSKTSEKSFEMYWKLKTIFESRVPVESVNCRLIFEGKESEINKAKETSKGLPQYKIYPKEYTNMTKDCPKFIKERGYITSSLTEEERNFPIAYSILMFDYVEQTERLLRAIYRPQNIYCIHVDAKASDKIFEAVSGIANCFGNVFTIQRIQVTWGTHSVITPEIICMRELWNKSKKWKYFINLTGQDFPLKTNNEIVQILKAYNGSNDVDDFMTNSDAFKNRLIGAGKSPHGILPMKGSVHVAVSRGFVDFVLHDYIARDFLHWASHTTHSSEIFFSSLHGNRFLNVPGSSRDHHTYFLRSATRYKIWDWSCEGKIVRNICIFGVGDLPKMTSRPELFANKFQLGYFSLTLDCLEELMFNRTRDQFLNKLETDVSRYKDGGYYI